MELKEVMIHIVLAVIMIICAAVDVKKKEIPIWIFVMLGITALAGSISIWNEDQGVYRMAAGVMPGILLLGMAKITEQSIGYGDGIVLAEIGCMMGAGVCMIILAGALALAGIFSIGMLVIKKVDRRYRIPFIPFLTTAYIVILCLQGVRI